MSKLNHWFVAGWQHSWAWFSVQLHVIGTFVLGIVLLAPALPAEVQEAVPVKWRVTVLAVWGVLGLVSRWKKQG